MAGARRPPGFSRRFRHHFTRDVGELLIGLLFLVQGFLEQGRHIVQP